MIAVKPLLEIRDLSVEYGRQDGAVRAVEQVSLEVGPGEFLGIVGESGCGKSTLLYAIARLLQPPARITTGSVSLQGRNLLAMDEEELREIRWRDYSIVMQSAMNALNPVLTVGDQIGDVILAHEGRGAANIHDRSAALLRMVGIDPVHLRSFPHQLSGGMRQRAMIAMALVFTPELVIMDEPTSALDVVAQRSLMLQIKELQRKIGFAAIFVTHDMSLVSHFSDRMAVMYAGQIVELGRTRELFDDPRHPYTQALMQSFPSITGPRRLLQGIPGTPPDLGGEITGCRFAPRCPLVEPRFRVETPPAVMVGDTLVRCHRYGRDR
jgi:peptide/nickel transport system ATP-binding protein